MTGAYSYLPPPPRLEPLPARGVPAGLRRIAGIAGTIVFAVGAVMWLASFIPGAPTAEFWPAIVMPAFLAIFPIFGVAVVDMTMLQKDRSPLRGPMAFPLGGWRRRAAAVVFLAPWLAFMGVFFSGDLAGSPYEEDGRYYTNNRGEITEVSHDDYLQAKAAESRIFSGAVVAFAGVAALDLTRPGEQSPPGGAAPAQLRGPRTSIGSWFLRVGGLTELAATGPGTPDELAWRLQRVAPVRIVERPTPAIVRIHADWDQKARWPLPLFPLQLDGTITDAAHGGSVMEATIRPASRTARAMPLQAVWGLFVVGLGVAIFGSAAISGVGGPVIVFLPFWAGWGLFLCYSMATGGRRISREVVLSLTVAASGA